MADKPLLAGAAQVDITPALGTQIAGDIGRYRPAEEIRDPLYAKALVLEQGGKRVCLLSLDLLAMTDAYDALLRAEAKKQYGLNPDALLVHILQSHSAPSLGHLMVSDEYPIPEDLWWLRGGDDRYHPVAVAGILKAIGKAIARLQPVKVAAGRVTDGRVAFNRRVIMRDGTARTHPPGGSGDILCSEGPMDPEVAVVTFRGKTGRCVAALLHHTCHPTHGYPQRWISADWPGAWSDGVKGVLGKQCVPLVINGFCGNVHHANPLDATAHSTYPEMGRKLTESTERALADMHPLEGAPLAFVTERVRFPLRRLTREELAGAKQIVRDNPEPMWRDETHESILWEWVYAHARLDLHQRTRRQPWIDLVMQGFRVGELGLVATPGEPFVQEQLRIKLKSPTPWTLVAHMCNGYAGYVPTPEAFRGGGYETWTCNGSQLQPNALRIFGDTCLRFLNELFP